MSRGGRRPGSTPRAATERPVAVTMGEPAGIGPEIVVKTFADPGFSTFPRRRRKMEARIL